MLIDKASQMANSFGLRYHGTTWKTRTGPFDDRGSQYISQLTRPGFICSLPDRSNDESFVSLTTWAHGPHWLPRARIPSASAAAGAPVNYELCLGRHFFRFSFYIHFAEYSIQHIVRQVLADSIE